jgi:hypothetical protein
MSFIKIILGIRKETKMIFKKKKQLKAVIMLMESDEKQRSKRYELPNKGTAKVSIIGNDLYIFDADGDKILEVNPQAGFTVEYTFEYDVII